MEVREEGASLVGHGQVSPLFERSEAMISLDEGVDVGLRGRRRASSRVKTFGRCGAESTRTRKNKGGWRRGAAIDIARDRLPPPPRLLLSFFSPSSLQHRRQTRPLPPFQGTPRPSQCRDNYQQQNRSSKSRAKTTASSGSEAKSGRRQQLASGAQEAHCCSTKGWIHTAGDGGYPRLGLIDEEWCRSQQAKSLGRQRLEIMDELLVLLSGSPTSACPS